MVDAGMVAGAYGGVAGALAGVCGSSGGERAGVSRLRRARVPREANARQAAHGQETTSRTSVQATRPLDTRTTLRHYAAVPIQGNVDEASGGRTMLAGYRWPATLVSGILAAALLAPLRPPSRRPQPRRSTAHLAGHPWTHLNQCSRPD